MKNEFNNRLGMAKTVLTTLDKPANFAIWQGKPPLAFTKKVALLRTKVAQNETLLSEQEAIITGFAEQKDSSEIELEDLAHEIGAALSDYYDDNDHQDLSAQVDFSISAWRTLREESLVARARIVEKNLGTTLTADAAGLVDYDLDAADLTALSAAIASYNDIIHSPQAAIANRKSLTKAARPTFRDMSNILGSLDKLILRFRKTDAGRQFVDAYLASRIVRDLGTSPAKDDPTTPPTP